jgi:hypothetical protein
MLRPVLGVAVATLALLALAAPADAQFHPRPRGGQGAGGDPSQMNCQQLAGMPNAPMTVESCEAMKAQLSGLQANVNSGAGARPGDEAMTCDQLRAELTAQQGFTGVSAEHRAQGQAAAAEFQSQERKVQAESAALAAQETATSAAASAATAFGGNAAGAAAGAANEARNAAFSAHAQAELAPSQRRMMDSAATSIGDLDQQMAANPRLGRLFQLAQQKNCH